jgi:hypothetical protein
LSLILITIGVFVAIGFVRDKVALRSLLILTAVVTMTAAFWVTGRV